MMKNFDLIDRSVINLSFTDIINNIFEENGHIVFLLDRTLKEYIFDEWIKDIKQKNIEYIPFGISKEEPNLFLLFIDNRHDLDLRIQEFEEILENIMNIPSSEYFLYGFGLIDDELANVAKKFKKKLKLQDKENTFLFRWYDPRVAVYLHKIFESDQINDLFSIFKHWVFSHPSGIYTYNNNENKKRFLNKIGINESKKLDLIEISNLIYFNLLDKVENIDHITIFESLQEAVDKKGLLIYQDIYLYGHYSSVIGQNFLDHNILKSKQKQYENFEQLIESITEEDWLKIKNDLSRVNYGN